MQVTVHNDSHVAPAVVWSRLADLAALSQWAPDVVESPADPLRVGAVRRARLDKPAFGKDTLVERVVAVEAPRSFTYDIDGGIGPLREIRTTWSVTPLGTGSRVAVVSEVELGGLLRYLPFLAKPSWTRQMQALVDAFVLWAR